MDLLDYITLKMNSTYLSDLSKISDDNMRREICYEIYRIRESLHDVEEWNEAIRYICGTAANFQKSSDAKQFFVQQLKRDK